MIIGGDHSIEFANVAGLADVYGKENVGVIHFDAHYDAGGTRSGHLISHAQPVRRLVDDGHILGRNFIQVGLRGSWPGPEGFEWMRENGLRYHTMAEIDRDGWNTVMQRVLDEANDGPEYLHISFDIDVMDPAYTSGTGTPVPGGLTPREVFYIVRGLCSENNLVGFDLVELNPLVDPGYTTALNAKQVVDECMTGVALQEVGAGQPGLPESADATGYAAVGPRTRPGPRTATRPRRNNMGSAPKTSTTSRRDFLASSAALAAGTLGCQPDADDGSAAGGANPSAAYADPSAPGSATPQPPADITAATIAEAEKLHGVTYTAEERGAGPVHRRPGDRHPAAPRCPS